MHCFASSIALLRMLERVTLSRMGKEHFFGQATAAWLLKACTKLIRLTVDALSVRRRIEFDTGVDDCTSILLMQLSNRSSVVFLFVF